MSLSKWSVAKRMAIPAALAVGVASAQIVVAAPANAAGDGTFSAYVYDRATGNNLQNLSVTLVNARTGAIVAGPLTTDASGMVQFPSLANGEYLVKVTDPSGKYNGGYSTSDTIDSLDDWAHGSVSLYSKSVNFGKLKGSVAAPGRNSVRGVVSVFPSTVTGAQIASGKVAPIETTWISDYDYSYQGNPEASWSINVPGGAAKYKVLVGDRSSPGGCDQVYDDDDNYLGELCTYDKQVWVGGTTADNAKQFSVANAKATTVDRVSFTPPASVSDPKVKGTVRGAGGAPLDDIRVDLLVECGDSWETAASTETGDDGTYAFSAGYSFTEGSYTYGGETYTTCYADYDYDELDPTTDFTLRFSDSYGGDEYKSVFLNGSTLEEGWPSAGTQTFRVPTSGATTKNVTLTQQPANRSSGINGIVADDSGKAIRGYVRVHDAQGNSVYSTDTRRDGSWSAPLSVLPPGTYKIEVSGNGTIDGWYGGKSFKKATTYTVAPGKVVNVGKSALARYATIKGKVTVPATATQDAKEAWVSVYNSVGKYYDDTEIDNHGNFVLRAAPGTYYVTADGARWSSFDTSDVGVTRQPMITQFWKGANSLRSATPVKLGSGKTVTLNFALGNQLAALAKPTVAGKAKKGKKLTASTGSWNVAENLTYTYAWKSGKKKVGSNSATYKIAKKDKKVSVTVTATDQNGNFVAGSSASKVVTIKKTKKNNKKNKGKNNKGKNKKNKKNKGKKGKKK